MPWSRKSRQQRGYGAAWDRVRLVVLRRDCYLCQCERCQAEDRTTPATEVDHRKSKAAGGTDELENLRAINKHCHWLKTLADQGKVLRERHNIGPDGYPTVGVA